VTFLHAARLGLAGVLTVLLVVTSVRSFLTENLPIIQRMVANPTQSYDSKVDVRWNEFSRFMRFIEQRTPEDAVILFPTGGKTGFFIERRSLAGYFLYPRNVISADSITPGSKATHVVTADGAPSFPVPGERSIFAAGRISDETVRPLKGTRDVRLTIYGLRVMDETGAVISTIEYKDDSAVLARRTGGRATRTTTSHEIAPGPHGLGEVFDFQFREPTEFDVWRLPLDLEGRAGQRMDLELAYSLREPGVLLTLEPSQSGVSAVIVEPLFSDPDESLRTLRIQDVMGRFQESAEAGRGGSLPGRLRFEARLIFTPGADAVYPDTGLIELARNGRPQ
jgi:hypothetical protein